MRPCYVSLPSGPVFDRCYEVLSRALTSTGFAPVRAGEFDRRPRVVSDMRESVQGAAVCIVDLTGRSSVPMYICGLAHGCGKPVILLAQDVAHLPLDLRLGQHIIYRPGAPRWEDMLLAQTQAVVRDC